MRNITNAIYNGKEYSAGIKKDGQIVLRSDNPKDISIGFWEKSIGKNCIYIKYVNRDELEEIYDKRISALYEGYEFDVVDEKDEMISIVTMGGDYRVWLSLGMECIDKFIYQKWIKKNEAEIKIVKETL